VEAYHTWAESEDKHIAKHYSQYAAHLRSKVQAMPIAQVTPGLLSALKKELMETPAYKKTADEAGKYKMLAGQTVNNIFNFMRAAVYRAIATGAWSGANPFATKRGGPWQLVKVNNARLRFFSPDEAKMLLADLEARNPQLHDMALLSLRTGLRVTEIFKLRGQDVDAQASILYIIEKGGKRTAVRVPDDIAAMLRGYERAPGEPIFQSTETGKALIKTPAAFRFSVKRLKLNPANGDSLYAVTFHTFRHTFASWLAQSGKVSLQELMKLMRHKNINMTLRYAHLMPGQESEKLSIIDGLLT
jgi:integrase